MNSAPQNKARLLKNWLSFAGGVLAASAFFAFLLLLAIDLISHNSNPYMGILAYVVAPGFLFMGLGMIGVGVWLERRREMKSGSAVTLRIDFTRPLDRRRLQLFIIGSGIFLLCTAIGSYQSYHISESVNFCGQTCHGPMNPEFVAYQNSPHAHVECVACHVGSGAGAYVKAKMNGVHQLLGVATGNYSHPIPTPIHNLRPARETCERCHWPKKFNGNLDRTYQHFLADETNTPFAVRLSLKVGGADASHGPVGGIHWHISQDNKIEYLATDDRRQSIPWVRVTNPKGEVTEYRAPGFTNDLRGYEVRTMDCLDCHNRPSHRYNSPNDAVDLALAIGRIDRSLPWVKSNLVALLVQPYSTQEQAMDSIAKALRARYAGKPQLENLVSEAQAIYSKNFFPEMKADWRAYPENIGHKNWPGCFRCHDGTHKTADKKKSIPASDCTSCHTFLAQGAGAELEKFNSKGDTFIHVDAPYADFDCSKCHTGAQQKE